MKKVKQTLLIRETGQDPGKVIPKRILRALRLALNRVLFDKKISVNPDTFFKEFSKKVFIDTHIFQASRDSNGRIVDVLSDIGPVSSGAYTMIHSFVYNYATGIHEGHAIVAFKYNDVLYCFNPWGKNYILTDKHSNRVLPDNHVWEKLRVMYGCAVSMVFSGKSYQDNDPFGSCVGLSADFGSFMYSHVMFEMIFPGQMIPIPSPSTAFEQVGNIIYSVEYNLFVERLITVSIGAFRDSLSSCDAGTNAQRVAHRLQSNEHVIPQKENRNYFHKRDVNLLNVFNRVVNSDVTFRNQVLATRSNDPVVVQNARKYVRNRLRNADPNLMGMHGNQINADIQRYMNSGNINISKLRNRNVIM